MSSRSCPALAARALAVLSLVLVLGPLPGCRQADRVDVGPGGEPPLDPELVHNSLRITERVYSGGEPHGAEAFRALARLGVRTIVSVDGARPQVEAARAAGIRTVHLPIGYDGVPPATVAALAQLASEVDGPIFVHCHHGKHRGPAAAVVLGRIEGTLDRDAGEAWLRTAGTSLDYPGLWASVTDFDGLDRTTAAPLVEVSEVAGLVEAMAHLDRATDHLKLFAKNAWRPIASHPDLVASREITLLREGLTESLRHLPDDASADLRVRMEEALARARVLEDSTTPAARDAAFTAVRATCSPCHEKYRNAADAMGAGTR